MPKLQGEKGESGGRSVSMCQATSRKGRNSERSCLYLTELVVRVRNLQADGSLLGLGLVQRTAQTAIVKADLIL